MSSPFQQQFSKKSPISQKIQSEDAPEIRTSDLGDVNSLDEFFTVNNVDYTLGNKPGSKPNTYVERRITDEVTGEESMQPLSDEEKKRMLIIRGLNEDNSLRPYQQTHGILETQGGEMTTHYDSTSAGRVYPRTVIANQPAVIDGVPNPDRGSSYNYYPTDLQITEAEYRQNRWNPKRQETFKDGNGRYGFDYESRNMRPRKYHDYRESEMPRLREADSTKTMNQRNFNANQRIALDNNYSYNRNPNQ